MAKLSFFLFLVLVSSSTLAGSRHQYKKIHVHAELNPVEGTVDYELLYETKRPLNELAQVFDPQSWARCNKRFKKSHYVGPDYKKVKNPPEPGSSWQGLIFEDFRPMPLKVAAVRNILKIKSIAHEDGIYDADLDAWLIHEFRFDLEKSLNNIIFWKKRYGGTMVDKGYINIYRKENGGFLIKGIKRLKHKLGSMTLEQTNRRSLKRGSKTIEDLARDLLTCKYRP